MANHRAPTTEGLRRYPQSNGYNYAVNPAGEPCTCQPSCPQRCAGECGCQACVDQFIAFCEAAGFRSSGGMPCEREEQALQAYKAQQE